MTVWQEHNDQHQAANTQNYSTKARANNNGLGLSPRPYLLHLQLCLAGCSAQQGTPAQSMPSFRQSMVCNTQHDGAKNHLPDYHCCHLLCIHPLPKLEQMRMSFAMHTSRVAANSCTITCYAMTSSLPRQGTATNYSDGHPRR